MTPAPLRRLALLSPFLALGTGIALETSLGWGLTAAAIAFLISYHLPSSGRRA